MHPLLHHVVLGRKGRLVAQSDHINRAMDKYGLCVGGTVRADLVSLLAAPLQKAKALSYSHEVCSLTQHGETVTVGLTDGTSREVDLVVGADGINSTVARLVFGEGDPPVYSGENIFYGVIDSASGTPPSFQVMPNGCQRGFPSLVNVTAPIYQFDKDDYRKELGHW